MILSKRAEAAWELLSKFYHLKPPELAVGTVRGKTRTACAVYVGKENQIYAMKSDILYNPFVMLHEFYHHLRSRSGEHKGTEKKADLYAKGFIESYKSFAAKADTEGKVEA